MIVRIKTESEHIETLTIPDPEIKGTGLTAWYNYHRGETFDVEPDDGNYVVISGRFRRRTIKKEHAVELGD